MAKAGKKQPFDVKVFLNTVAVEERILSEGPEGLLPGRPGGCRILHPGGEGQGLRRLRAGKGGRRRAPREWGLLRRELPERTSSARGDGRDGDGMRHHANREGSHRARAPRRAEVLRDVHGVLVV